MTQILIKDLPTEERPRERLMQVGARSLSNPELLAIILRTGSKQQSVLNLSQSILNRSDGIKGLNDILVEELIEVPGVGSSKAVQILAAVELGKRTFKEATTKEINLLKPEDCYNFLAPEMKHLTEEHFIALYLNVKGSLIAQKTLSIGTLDRAIVHPRELFKEAVKRSAASIIISHNHPSGDPKPSTEDLFLTQTLVEAGELMDIPISDHIIIGDGDYRSLRSAGLL